MPAKRARSQSIGPGEAVLLGALLSSPEPPAHEGPPGVISWKWIDRTCILHAPLRPGGASGLLSVNMDQATSMQEQYDGSIHVFFQDRMIVMRNEMVTAFKDALQAVPATHGPGTSRHE